MCTKVKKYQYKKKEDFLKRPEESPSLGVALDLVVMQL